MGGMGEGRVRGDGRNGEGAGKGRWEEWGEGRVREDGRNGGGGG